MVMGKEQQQEQHRRWWWSSSSSFVYQIILIFIIIIIHCNHAFLFVNPQFEGRRRTTTIHYRQQQQPQRRNFIISTDMQKNNHLFYWKYNPLMMKMSLSSSSSSESIKKPMESFTDAAAASAVDTSDDSAPSWMKCINAITPRKMALNEAVSNLANVSLIDALDLIDIGAVWVQFPYLTKMDVLSQYSEYDHDNDNDVVSWVNYADFPSGWGSGNNNSNNNNNDNEEEDNDNNEEEEDDDEEIMKSSQRYTRVCTSLTIEAGTKIRIYPIPRRFPSCYEIDETKLLYEDTTFIVVDKPPMLPTQPDASNYMECCPGCVNDLLGPFQTIDREPVIRPLICHRVDACVGGCVVLSKDPNGQRVFSELQRNRKIKKIYLALTTKPVPLGMHIHWVWAPLNKRGEIAGPPCQLLSHTPPSSRRKARQSWIRCVLEVTQCDPINIPSSIYPQPTTTTTTTTTSTSTTFYQSTIRLVTGRKHQVRAQLSSLGCPIVHDTLYEPIAGMTLDQLDNDAENENEIDLERAIDLCRVPTKPIGLQAHGIIFGGIRVHAGSPWWNNNNDDDDKEKE